MTKLLTLFCFLLCIYFPSHGQEIKYESTIDILTQSDTNKIEKEHELMVMHENDMYVIEFNIKHGRKIQTHRAKVGSDKHFSKASFIWESENKVAVKLFDPESMDKFELKVWGDKRSTGMQVDTEESDKR